MMEYAKNVALALFVLFALGLAGCRKKSAPSAAAAASSQDATAKRWEEEFRKRDEAAAAARAAARQPGAPERVDAQLRRATLARLAKEPRYIKPFEEAGPDETVPWRTYAYNIDGLGTVRLWRNSEDDWFMMVQGLDASVYAPPDGMRELVSSEAGRWWRVTDGPFADHYVIAQKNGVVEARSAVATCTKKAALPAAVLDACQHP